MERQIPPPETNYGDRLHEEEFAAQYTAVGALIEETIALGHDHMTGIFTARLCELERENPVAHFQYQNKKELALMATGIPPAVVAAIARGATISKDPDYAHNVFAELSFQRMKENIPEEWDATEYMDNEDAKLYSEFVADLLIARLKDI